MSLTSAYPGTAPSASPRGLRLPPLTMPSRDTVEYLSAVLNLFAWLVGLGWLVWLSTRVGPTKALGKLARSRVG